MEQKTNLDVLGLRDPDLFLLVKSPVTIVQFVSRLQLHVIVGIRVEHPKQQILAPFARLKMKCEH